MLKHIWDWLKVNVIDRVLKLFGKSTSTANSTAVTEEKIKKDLEIKEFVYDRTLTFKPYMLQELDYSKIPAPEIINPEAQVTVIIVDDIEHAGILYKNDFEKLKDKKIIDTDGLKIVRCLGQDAGFMAYKYAVIERNPVDYGILDITLGHKIRVFDEWFKEFDGIDLAIAIQEAQPTFKFLFATAHTLNQDNHTVRTYNEKSKRYLQGGLDKYYLSKNTNRVDTIANLLKVPGSSR